MSSAGAATIAANREAVAREVGDAAAIARYQQQLAEFRAEQDEYRRQTDEAARRAAAYKVLQDQYAAKLAELKTAQKPVIAPNRATADDDRANEVHCRDVMLTGSRIQHRECHTRKEWKAIE